MLRSNRIDAAMQTGSSAYREPRQLLEVLVPRAAGQCPMASAEKPELKIDLVRQYLDRERLDCEPLQFDLDNLFDDPKIRKRVGEVIANALLGEYP
jgi:hypothetical protein